MSLLRTAYMWVFLFYPFSHSIFGLCLIHLHLKLLLIGNDYCHFVCCFLIVLLTQFFLPCLLLVSLFGIDMLWILSIFLWCNLYFICCYVVFIKYMLII